MDQQSWMGRMGAALLSASRVSIGSAVAGLVAVGLLAGPAAAQTGPASFEKFATFDDTTTTAPDYEPIKEFLGAFSEARRGRLLLTYSRMTGPGMGVLEQYRLYLERIPVTRLSKDVQLAYWLNFHNWMVIEAIALEDKRRRITDQRGTPLEPGGMWSEKRATVSDVLVSIDDIEQRIVLAHWDNPLVLYGLYQGTKGGPPITKEPFKGDTVYAQLEQIGRVYLASKTGGRAKRKSARVSEFYDWYKDVVFDGDDAALLAHLKSLAPKKFGEAEEVTFNRFDYTVDELELRQPRQQGGRPLPPAGGLGGGGRGS